LANACFVAAPDLYRIALDSLRDFLQQVREAFFENGGSLWVLGVTARTSQELPAARRTQLSVCSQNQYDIIIGQDLSHIAQLLAHHAVGGARRSLFA
jgi:hypothetical protein